MLAAAFLFPFCLLVPFPVCIPSSHIISGLPCAFPPPAHLLICEKEASGEILLVSGSEPCNLPGKEQDASFSGICKKRHRNPIMTRSPDVNSGIFHFVKKRPIAQNDSNGTLRAVHPPPVLLSLSQASRPLNSSQTDTEPVKEKERRGAARTEERRGRKEGKCHPLRRKRPVRISRILQSCERRGPTQ